MHGTAPELESSRRAWVAGLRGEEAEGSDTPLSGPDTGAENAPTRTKANISERTQRAVRAVLAAAIALAAVAAAATFASQRGAGAEFRAKAAGATAALSFACPVETPYNFTDTFAAPRPGGRTHRGADLFGEKGTPITAIVGGEVTKAVPTDDGTLGGARVWVSGDDGWWYYYAHLDSVSVELGARIETGAQLGTLGNSGNAAGTPPHVHIEQHFGSMTGPFVNPYALISVLCTEGS